LFLLSTNDKTIKLWKVYEKQRQVVTSRITATPRLNGLYEADSSDLDGRTTGSDELPDYRRLCLPQVEKQDFSVHATLRRTYQNAHAYHINSLSLNSDGETFISADDLRINLWNLGISGQSFNIVDIKPINMEELTEVITAAEFHPSHCNHLVYSNSKGTIRLLDTRVRALCDHDCVRTFQEAEDPQGKSFFSEIISSISDLQFSLDGCYILSRDYLTLKVWDWRSSSAPVKTIFVHEFLRSKLCDLYESDCIFDKFECAFSGDARQMVTGSYNNYLRIYDMHQQDILLHADRAAIRAKRAIGPASTPGRLRLLNKCKKKDEINADSIDFSRKILHLAYHPKEDTIAVAGTNNLFICTRP
jgi:serine/threonine-protein phosphatase 2A regulatory subunit B